MMNRMKQYRHESRHTMMSLSVETGISQSHIQSMELQNGACPSIKLAYKISHALGKSVHDIWPDPQGKKPII